MNLNKQTLVVATLVAASPLVNGLEAKTKPQNVLFILVDDLGWNDLGFMGSSYYESPNIDRLAASGIVFTDAYAACQVSSPSRASIMSGLYPANHGITNWIGELTGEAWRKHNRHSKVLPAEYDRYIKPEYLLMPELLRDSGFSTFFAGKWHLGDDEEYWPDQNGFEINIGGWKSGGPQGGYFSPYKNPRLENKVDGENLEMRLANETVAFIEEHEKTGSKKPFFAYLSFYAVHSPIECNQEYWQHFRDKADSMGIAQTGFMVDRNLPQRQQQDNPVYAGLIKHMDDAVGRVLTALEELGLDDETLVIFTSDNGGVVAGDNFSTSLKPLRGGKGIQFEGGIRVPLVVRSPESVLNGSTCSTPINGIDYYPTIMSYSGVELPEQMQELDGVDFTPILRGEDIAPRSLFWHYPHYGNQGGEPSTIIRKGDWKLIYYHEDQRCELYNLQKDISESQHINLQYPDKVEELRDELMVWLDKTGAKIPEPDMEYDPKAEAKVLLKYKTATLKQKENERQKMLSPTFQPNADWWGSHVVVD